VRQRDARGWQPPSPPTAGAQRCTEGPPHARTRSSRLWRCVGRVGGEAGLRALRNSWSKVGRAQLSQACPRADRVSVPVTAIYVLPLYVSVCGSPAEAGAPTAEPLLSQQARPAPMGPTSGPGCRCGARSMAGSKSSLLSGPDAAEFKPGSGGSDQLATWGVAFRVRDGNRAARDSARSTCKHRSPRSIRPADGRGKEEGGTTLKQACTGACMWAE
jgi:hypothetical protein